MKVYFADRQLAHAPQQFLMAGRFVAPFEVPERAEAMARRLADTGFDITQPTDHGLGPIKTVHGDAYPEFLASAYEQFQQLPVAGPEAFPNVHPHVSGELSGAARGPCKPSGIVGKLGWYMGDMACAIGPGTYTGAYWSAQAAIAAAASVVGGAQEAVALCRPPGHHAYRDRASGFCFFNNAAIAAELLREQFGRIAILDFDTHHGDGTQAIYYADADVFVGSTHTNPDAYYPFFVGYSDETGVDHGRGANLNIPLAPGTEDDAFVTANERLIEAALGHGARALIVSAGWDAHGDDPLSKLAITDETYAHLGKLYGSLQLPTLIVQEGGYSLAAIERVAPAFMTAFQSARRGV
ncbi:MAG: histone deacetylase family protein [Pseudomonadota bacterium]